MLDFEESPIISMAKTIVRVATDTVGNNIAKKKDRQTAVDIIFNRCGGAKIEPVADTAEIEVVEAE